MPEGPVTLSVIHAWTAGAAGAVSGAMLVVGALDGLRLVAARRLLDGLVIALLVVLLLGTMLGPLVVITTAPPRDPLHLLYAGVALVAAPITRFEAARRRVARTGWWLGLGGLVTLGALLRLWVTGG